MSVIVFKLQFSFTRFFIRAPTVDHNKFIKRNFIRVFVVDGPNGLDAQSVIKTVSKQLINAVNLNW